MMSLEGTGLVQEEEEDDMEVILPKKKAKELGTAAKKKKKKEVSDESHRLGDHLEMANRLGSTEFEEYSQRISPRQPFGPTSGPPTPANARKGDHISYGTPIFEDNAGMDGSLHFTRSFTLFLSQHLALALYRRSRICGRKIWGKCRNLLL